MQRRPLHELKPVPGMANGAALGSYRSERLRRGEGLALELILHPQLHKEMTYCMKDAYVYSIPGHTARDGGSLCLVSGKRDLIREASTQSE